MRQLQHGIEQANETNLVSRFAEYLAKRKINPSSNFNLHRHEPLRLRLCYCEHWSDHY